MERKVFGAAQPGLRDDSPQTLQLHLPQGSDPTVLPGWNPPRTHSHGGRCSADVSLLKSESPHI